MFYNLGAKTCVEFHRESGMSAHVLLYLLNQSQKRDKILGSAKHFITFSQGNKFINTGA